MRLNSLKAILKTAVLGAAVLLIGAGGARAQQQINLIAQPTNAVLPDGSSVPMWGYSCGAVVTTSSATCAPLNKNAGTAVAATTTLPAVPGWSPVVITIPTTATGGLTINLTNNLVFANGNSVPTSLMIVGQVGGGLGVLAQRTTTPSPVHGAQSTTWPTANVAGVENIPPSQGPRVRSFGTEVAAVAASATPTGTPLTWPLLKPGTYLLESGTHPSIQVPMGLYGILVVTAAPTATTAGVETAVGTAYPGVTYDAEVPVELSELDPVQNNLVSTAVNLPGFSETTVWSGQPGGCGNPATANAGNCYPPAVNYTPLYYMINGVAFNKTVPGNSVFPITPATIAPAACGGAPLIMKS